MIAYNPKDWLKLIFIFHKSDTFRMLLPALLVAAVYSTFLTYISVEMHYLEFKSTTVIHSLLGFVISMLLVFRTNTAYDRWWEGRKLWGELVNSSRNFALKISTMMPSEAKKEKDNLLLLIGNFPFILKEHLRGCFKANEFESNNTISIDDLNKVVHKPNAMIWAIEKEVMLAYSNKNISNGQLLLLNDELKTMANVCGACERIKNTPIPYSYSMFLKKFIFAYVFTMPLGFVYDFKYWTAPIVVFIFYAFASIELIAEEIEDPFGTDANDLPLDAIAITIRTNVKEIATFD
jgi:ion channel-forming bestrophin family protein